jgi:nitrogen fixation-related uncharacterized protein
MRNPEEPAADLNYHFTVHEAPRDSLNLPTAATLSILLHVVAVAIFLWASTAGGQSQAIAHDVPTEQEDEETPAEPLGIDESEAETLTWIGYEEYAEHLARLSEVEQAAMSTAPRSGGGGSPPPSNSSASVAQAAAPAIPMSARPSAAAPATTMPSPETDSPEILIASEMLLDERTEPTAEPDAVDSETTEDSSTSETESTPDPTTTPDEQTATKEETDEDSSEDAEPESPTEEKPTPDPTPEPAPKPTPEPTPAPQPSPKPSPKPTDSDDDGDVEGEGPGEPAAEPGNDADKDSEATSLVRVPASEWKQGKPLAAQGLNIRTRRPNIPIVAWLRYRPKLNPVAQIEFDRTGTPIRASLVVKSGADELDERLTDMLYRWRASGKRLTELTGNETVTIELQLLLN